MAPEERNIMNDESIDRRALLLIPLPLLIALVLILSVPAEVDDPFVKAAPDMAEIRARNADELERRFEDLGYTWPPESGVPPISVQSFPADMPDLDTEQRRELFFRVVLPLALAENQRTLELQHQVRELHETLLRENRQLTDEESDWLMPILERYRITGDPNEPAQRERLLRRLDVIPVSLTLAQAANESGWGTSRFTREANNIFGEWTWDAGTGLVPERRPEGATHFVRSFPSLAASVSSYVRNLNTHPAYQPLRAIRRDMRQQGQVPTGIQLAAGLERYSERGQAYVREIRSMIRQNRLEQLPEDLELEEP